jgi:hypothetical protein
VGERTIACRLAQMVPFCEGFGRWGSQFEIFTKPERESETQEMFWHLERSKYKTALALLASPWISMKDVPPPDNSTIYLVEEHKGRRRMHILADMLFSMDPLLIKLVDEETKVHNFNSEAYEHEAYVILNKYKHLIDDKNKWIMATETATRLGINNQNAKDRLAIEQYVDGNMPYHGANHPILWVLDERPVPKIVRSTENEKEWWACIRKFMNDAIHDKHNWLYKQRNEDVMLELWSALKRHQLEKYAKLKEYKIIMERITKRAAKVKSDKSRHARDTGGHYYDSDADPEYAEPSKRARSETNGKKKSSKRAKK